MFIDTHSHIFSEYYSDIDCLIESCKNNKIKKIIVSGCDLESNKEVLRLIDKYDIVYGTIGFHPTELSNFSLDDLDLLEENISHPKIVGIGEIGLDYHYDNNNKNLQNMVFKRQLDLAKKHNMPIIVHSRDSVQDTYNILKEYKLKGSIHCFSGSVQMARKFTKIGYYIGIGGIITYENAKIIKEVVKDTSLTYILLETDSPYLTPNPYRGSINSPSYIPIIAKMIGELKDVSTEEVASVTTSNAEAIFDKLLK